MGGDRRFNISESHFPHPWFAVVFVSVLGFENGSIIQLGMQASRPISGSKQSGPVAQTSSPVIISTKARKPTQIYRQKKKLPSNEMMNVQQINILTFCVLILSSTMVRS